MALAIDVSNLTKRYGAVTALNRISFQVERGEVMGFLGPNGAGKTTTLRILTGLIEPTEGLVRVEGMDVANHPVEVRRRIGYLPENVSLYPELRVEEYLTYRAKIKGVERRQRRVRLDGVLQRCALGDVRRRIIGRLSKGYRQRVGLADCLIAQPSILILDEPTVGLDPHQIRQTRELIKALGRQTTVLLSTHILPEVELICDRVTIIDHGVIVAIDSPENLRRAMTGAHVVHVELRGESRAIEQAVAQVRSVPGVQAEIRVPLEEVFIRLTTKDAE